MMIKGMITARCISDEYGGDFIKGEVYDNLYWPRDDTRKCIIVFVDKYGEEYGISASCFEIIEDRTPDDWWKVKRREEHMMK